MSNITERNFVCAADVDIGAAERELQKQISIKGDSIVINVEYEYIVDLSRCNTPDRILHWVHHLTEKAWMTNRVMRRFIELATRAHGISLH